MRVLRQGQPILTMTPAQTLIELRRELAMHERIAELIRAVAKHTADDDLRRTYGQLDHASLLRLTGAAAGVEDFARLITDAPNKTARHKE